MVAVGDELGWPAGSALYSHEWNGRVQVYGEGGTAQTAASTGTPFATGLCLRNSGTPGGIRTPDARLRTPPLYPAELPGHSATTP